MSETTRATLALAYMLIGLTTAPVHGEPRPGCELATAAGAITAAWPDAEPLLQLRWVDVSGMPAGPLAAAIAEAERLLEPAGIRVTARALPAGRQVPAGSMIVLFGRDREGAGDDTLWGAAPAGRDSAVWVYPRRIASALGLDPAVPHAWPAAGDIRFRRLLGAVVTHELLHVLAGAPHAEEGVMAASLSRSDPVFGFRVETALHARVREGVARLSAAGMLSPALPLD